MTSITKTLGLQSATLLSIVALVIAVRAVGGLEANSPKISQSHAEGASRQNIDLPKDSVSTTTSDVTTKSKFRSGTYTETVAYRTPGGTHDLSVTVELTDDTVTSAIANGDATNLTSRSYQDDFIAGYEEYVVGKPIDQLDIATVSNASLTTDAFNEALAAIATQARNQ